MKLIPILITALHLTAGPTSICEQFLSCGTFTGTAVQNSAGQTDAIDETFEIKDTAIDTVTIVERSTNRTTGAAIQTTWDLFFAPDGTFSMKRLGQKRPFGAGSCVNRTCNFAIRPDIAPATGSFVFSDDGFSYGIGQLDGAVRDFGTRFVIVKRATPSPQP